ncbi:MAG: acetyl-CoA C-acetyltransferase [Alcanivorax sp.]|jgi:acetyl-CoA C-acetyltransferase
MNEANMPVLIGCGQVTDKRPPEEGGTPIDLMAEVSRKAALDAGPGDVLLNAINTIVAMGLTVDSPESGSEAGGMVRNVPQAVCAALNINPAEKRYTYNGGNTPQLLVNRYAEQIAQGEESTVLLVGAEALHTMIGRLKKGLDLDAWIDQSGDDPWMLGDSHAAASDHEMGYGMHMPSTVYPLFENALRVKYSLSLGDHQKKMGDLYHRFNAVAVNNPLSWFPTERSSEDIATVGEKNRYVGFPYTKFLNSVIQVNMGAAVIMTSLAKARELGVEDDRMVYLHGCADVNDIWNVSERVDYHSSPAIRTMGERAFAMSGKTIDDMAYFDIYSCFPSAVQIACDELGISHNDERGLTVTGGLPYFGGPGNNYVTHSIATMMDVLRSNRGKFGLLNANGWFITKHSMGIYSTTPVSEDWQRETPANYQQAILDAPHPPFTEAPSGRGTIETYTVLHGREGVERALVIGLLDDGTRFIAETPDDEQTLGQMMDQEMIGVTGIVRAGEKRNLFVPEFNQSDGQNDT